MQPSRHASPSSTERRTLPLLGAYALSSIFELLGGSLSPLRGSRFQRKKAKAPMKHNARCAAARPAGEVAAEL
jgi:hypothetical protein